MLCFKTLNFFAESRYNYFLSDPPFRLETLYNSGFVTYTHYKSGPITNI